MKLITHKHVVLRYSSRTEFQATQVPVRRTMLLGQLIWWKEIDREEVPSWALISLACLGYHDWKSRLFAQYAHLLDLP